MLDEIICLGSNLPNDKFKLRRVSGVVLHVEKSGETPEYSLTFRRENASVVQIGRRSGHEPAKVLSAPSTSAMFRCAVVSRKHAKIVFSDSGQAYIIDSGSHHGTHLRKFGDTVSRMLKPETSTLLTDGDTITFGKPVGKGDEWVKPVVALVQLVHAPTPFNALTVPSPSSSENSKSSSGRYGIHDSTSSDDLYSDSSDVEEIPPPASSPIKVISHPQESQDTTAKPDPKPCDQSQDLVQATAAYCALERLISPAIKRLPSVNEIIKDKGSDLFEVATKPFPNLLSLFPAPIRRQDDARRRDINELGLDSRSSSPMDLASPEPLVGMDSGLSTPLLTPVVESVANSFVPLFDWHALVPYEAGTPSPPGVSEPTPLSPDAALNGESPPVEDDPKPPAPLPTSRPTTNETTEISPTAFEVEEIQRMLKQIEASVSKLHVSRRKYKNRFNANVSFMSNRQSEIDDKFAEVDAEYNVLCDQVEEIQHGDLPDFARQIEDLNERVDAIITARINDRLKTAEAPSSPPMSMEDMKISVKLVNDLIDELRASHLKSQEEFATYLLDMTIAREEAMRVVEQAKAIVASSTTTPVAGLEEGNQTPVLTSLKRKRDDMDEDEGASVGQAKSAQGVPADGTVNGAADGEKDVIMIEQSSAVNQDNFTTGTVEVTETSTNVEPPPRKKIRTIGSVVAQTATAVTIGAVITWSALAFS